MRRSIFISVILVFLVVLGVIYFQHPNRTFHDGRLTAEFTLGESPIDPFGAVDANGRYTPTDLPDWIFEQVGDIHDDARIEQWTSQWNAQRLDVLIAVEN